MFDSILNELDKNRPNLAQHLRDILTFAEKPHMSMSKFQHKVLAPFVLGVADGEEGWRSYKLIDLAQHLYYLYLKLSNEDCAPCYECGVVTKKECCECAAKYYQEKVKHILEDFEDRNIMDV